MKKSVVILLHTGYWFLYLILLVFILFCLSVGLNPNGAKLFANYNLKVFIFIFAMLPAVLGFYSYYFVLFDWFLMRKKILLLFVCGIAAACGCGILSSFFLSVLASFKVGTGIFNDGFESATAITIILAIIALLNGGMGLLLKGFITWYEDLKTKEDLTKKNFEMEMALIKSQLDPHFLFNTINNIDILIEKDAAKASVFLNKLSDIMRFMLYETKTTRIPLHEEWTYLQKYIELQKIRTAHPNFIQYTLEGDMQGVLIAPMTLIPFVENAFKHAEGIKANEVIDLLLRVESDTIIFECNNKYLLSTDATLDNFGGLGNSLIQKRLALLYPQKHTLEIEDENGWYRVKLRINL